MISIIDVISKLIPTKQFGEKKKFELIILTLFAASGALLAGSFLIPNEPEITVKENN